MSDDVNPFLDDPQDAAEFLAEHFPSRPLVEGKLSDVDARYLEHCAEMMQRAWFIIVNLDYAVAEAGA